MTHLRLSWRFRDGARPDLSCDSPSLVEALSLLERGADEADLLRAAGDGAHAKASLLFHVHRLWSVGLLVTDVTSDGEWIATLVPRSSRFDPILPSSASGTWQLSRFAYLRRVGEALVLESPEAPASIRLGATAAAWVWESVRVVTTEEENAQAQFLNLLGELSLLTHPDVAEDEAQQTWEFHDRMFHRATRRFDDFEPHGGTYRFRERFPAPPAIRSDYSGETSSLAAPPTRGSRALRDVMEARRSRREMGEQPVTRDQVSEVLYRVARVREHWTGEYQECLRRPYPSGGAIHELEFYLAVRACDGLDEGFYHYRSADHALTKLPGTSAPAREMLADCAHAWGRPGETPQCLIVLSSRLPRLAWKYEGIAYKLSLMHAGVVVQSLYLVCTDLGLAGAAAGTGRPELFAAATGNASWEETSIAEFGFGAPP